MNTILAMKIILKVKKMTREDLAARMTGESTISIVHKLFRYKKHNKQIPTDLMIQMATATGIPLTAWLALSIDHKDFSSADLPQAQQRYETWLYSTLIDIALPNEKSTARALFAKRIAYGL